jgi:hypothetical protein
MQSCATATGVVPRAPQQLQHLVTRDFIYFLAPLVDGAVVVAGRGPDASQSPFRLRCFSISTATTERKSSIVSARSSVPYAAPCTETTA